MKYKVENNILTIVLNPALQKQTLKDFFDTYFIAKKTRYFYLSEKRIQLDGKMLMRQEDILDGNELTIHFRPEQIDWCTAQEEAEIIYEDAFVCIVHKEAGIIIHGDEDDDTCLNARVAKYYAEHNIQSFVRPIHRLDGDTTGLVLYSKISFFQPWFDEQLKQKKIARQYQAICYGNKKVNTAFCIHEPIGKDRHHSNRYRVSPTGKDAITYCKILAQKDGLNLVQCDLETGRTHQIRVHLSNENLPIVNDPFYGRKHPAISGMGLWACSLTFRNPLSNKKHVIKDSFYDPYAYFWEDA